MGKRKKTESKLLNMSGEFEMSSRQDMISSMETFDSMQSVGLFKEDVIRPVDSVKMTDSIELEAFSEARPMMSMSVMGEPKSAKMMSFTEDLQPARKQLVEDFVISDEKGEFGTIERGSLFGGINLATAAFFENARSVQAPVFKQAVKKESAPADLVVDENGEPVIYNNLFIMNFPDMEIDTFCITNKVNEHAKLVFTAFIDDQEKDVLKNAVVCTPIKVVYLSNKGASIPFFSGVITNVRVYVEDGHQAVQVTALSNSSSMDTIKNSASCQNTGTTYEALIKKVCGKSKAAVTYGIGGDALSAAMGAISVQYRETDWEYVCRLASQKNLGLFVDMTKDAPVFSIGASGNMRKDVSVIAYEMAKDVRNFEIDHANYIENINDKDYVLYKVESYNILKVGDKQELDGKELYVREANYEMKNAIVLGTYVLCPIRGLQQRRMKHTKIQGLSLNGKTVGVERDKVRVQLDIDSESNADYLFPYSTMSASPDGSGWYCMPQEGDLVRVYFPDDDEANAFAISSVSSYDGSGGNDMMSDPSVVYLRSPNNMVLRLSPDGILINANDGQGVINMDASGNITIAASNSLSVSASNDVNIIAAKNMSVMAGDSLKLSGQGGAIEMDSSGNTKVTGQYVLEN